MSYRGYGALSLALFLTTATLAPAQDAIIRPAEAGRMALNPAAEEMPAMPENPPAMQDIGLPTLAPGPQRPAKGGGDKPQEKGKKMDFSNVPIGMILDAYAKTVNRTLLMSPNLPKVNITLQSQNELTLPEYVEAIETVVSMNGIALLKEGEKFIKVVPIAKAREEPIHILSSTNDLKKQRADQLISQMIQLKNIDLADAEAAIKPLLHDFGQGQMHRFERNNSLLITDTPSAIERVLYVLGQIDQPLISREEPTIVEIKFTKASEIKKKLEEIIADADKETKKATAPHMRESGPPGAENRPEMPSIPGVIRPARATELPTQPEEMASLVAEAERGIIRGKVKIIADDRTNILIIITRPENMTFFSRIIKVLDVRTDPDVSVRVRRLEFAQAEEVATMLNSLIGVQSSKENAPAGAAAGAKPGANPESKPLREYAEQNLSAQAQAALSPQAKSRLGELSKENIKILSDKRTNALILMASKSDQQALEEIIKDMDMMLSQVLIEAVILQINLTDKIQTGIDWVQRSMAAYKLDGANGRTPLFSFAGGGGGGTHTPVDASTLTGGGGPTAGQAGLTYFFTHFGLNLDAVVHMAAQDSRAQVLASPVILTHDNTEAKIDASEEKYFFKGKRWVGSSTTSDGRYEDDVESRKVGLHLTVNPHINEKKLVLMEISQQIEDFGDDQPIGGQLWPTVITREMSASIAVADRETIVLGGLVKKNTKRSRSGIPILSKIPLLGLLFSSMDSNKSRSEIVVFITPYVLDTPEAIEQESRRRAKALSLRGIWKRGWSQSRIADSPWTWPWEHDDTLPPPRTPAVTAPKAQSETGGPDLDVMSFIEQQEKNMQPVVKPMDASAAPAAQQNP